MGHITVILNKCPAEAIADFYTKRASDEGWSRSMLQAMIASQLHERSHPALTAFDRSAPGADREAVRELVKDSFILDLLAAGPVRERDLSRALTENLSRFLRELGVGWPSSAPRPPSVRRPRVLVDLLFHYCRFAPYRTSYGFSELNEAARTRRDLIARLLPRLAIAGSDLGYLPFEGDLTLSVIVSKAMLLAHDGQITDPAILRQL